MRISSAVCGHQARQQRAEHLARTIRGQTVLDTGAFGPGANHWRTWAVAQAQDPKADWVMVVEDDAIPVTGFNTQLTKVLRSSPVDVISLYAGTSRPPQWQQRLQAAIERDTCWILSDHMLHGVGIVIRRPLVKDLLVFVDSRRPKPYDEQVGAWARDAGLQIGYSNPSLLDHADLPTLVRHRDGQPRSEARVAWRTGVRRSWTDQHTYL